MAWRILTDRAGILAVHAAYMGFGKIAFFSGDQHDRYLHDHGEIDATRLFDCNSLDVAPVASPGFDVFCSGHAFLGGVQEVRLLVAGGTQVFQIENPAAHHHGHFPGLRDSAAFVSPQIANPSSGGWAWLLGPRMNRGIPLPGLDPARTGGRWYPTLTTLPNGDVIATAGHPGSDDQHHHNFIPEIASSAPGNGAPGGWRPLASYTNAADSTYFSSFLRVDPNQVNPVLYPRVHLLPTGDLLFSTPMPLDRARVPQRLDPPDEPLIPTTITLLPDVGPSGGTFTPVCLFPRGTVDGDHGLGSEVIAYGGFGSTSVLLPLGERPLNPAARNDSKNYHARVLICGGASAQPYLLDLTGWDPLHPTGTWTWKPVPGRAAQESRVHGYATILPTGEILISGGINQPETRQNLPAPPPVPDASAVRWPEIYDPYSGTWTALTTEKDSIRNYHSVALLMPDGRVWSAGSNTDGNQSWPDGLNPHPPAPAPQPQDNRNLDIGLFEPWYYGNPNRPHIDAAPDHARPGETVFLRSTFAPEIDRIVLVRCGSATHAFNTDQRFIELSFKYQTDDVLLTTLPASNNVMPPGPYLIYTLRLNPGTLGLPSNGTDIYILPREQG